MKKLILLIVLISISAIQLYGQSIELKKETVYKGNFIGNVEKVALDSKGQIYIGDLINHNIHLFSSSGKYLKQIGRQGRGPGEFQYIWGLQIGRKDSLYVLDGELNRITVFAAGKYNYPAYTIDVESGPNGGTTRDLWVDNRNNNFYVAYVMYYFRGNLNKPHYLKIYRLNHKGNIVDKTPLVKIKSIDRLITTHGKGFMVGAMPFGQTPVVQMSTDGYFYFGNSDNFNIKEINLKGKIIRDIKYKVEPIRITETMWDKVVKNNPGLTSRMLKNSLIPLPKYKRLFDDFVIDDNGLLWVAVNTRDMKNFTWMIFDENNKLLTKFKFPKSVIFKIIKKGYAYGIYTDKMGVQSVIKYKIINENK